MATDPPQSPETAEGSEGKSRRVQLWLVVLAVLVLGGVVEVIIYGYLARPGWIGSSGKQFWDYLDLLIVPAALALGVYWLNRRQTERDQQAEEAQRKRAQQAEEAQQKRALAVESQRAQDEALQAYLDQMEQLLIEHPLRRARPGDNLSTVARARTLTVLTRVDRTRKQTVLQFLYEPGLIYSTRPVLALIGADLSGADLYGATLYGATLSNATLSEADLGNTNLRGANLRGADLSEANLSQANRLTVEQLSAAISLEGATMPDGQTLRVRGYKMPDGPTFEDWLKDRERVARRMGRTAPLRNGSERTSQKAEKAKFAESML